VPGTEDPPTADAGAAQEAPGPVALGALKALNAPELLETIEVRLLGGPPVYTRTEVAQRCDVPLEVAEQLWHSLGFPHSADDAVVFTEADVKALEQTMRLIRAGILDEDSQAAMVRTWGRSFARLAEWQTTLLASIAVAADDPEARMEELAELHLASAPVQRVEPAAAAAVRHGGAEGRRVRRHRRLHHAEQEPRRRRAGQAGRALRGGCHQHGHRPRRPADQDHRRRGALRGRHSPRGCPDRP
jgi:hypothetical protein